MWNVMYDNIGQGLEGIKMFGHSSASKDDEFPPNFGLGVRARKRLQDVIFHDGLLWFLTAEMVCGDSVFHSHVVSPV